MYRAVAAHESRSGGAILRDNSEELKHKKRQNEATLGWHDMLQQVGRRLGD